MTGGRAGYLGPPGTFSEEALLDAHRNGVVLSALATRESARLYCKQVVDGRGELKLSPEEAEAIRLALAGEELRSVTLDT